MILFFGWKYEMELGWYWFMVSYLSTQSQNTLWVYVSVFKLGFMYYSQLVVFLVNEDFDWEAIEKKI